MKIAVVSGKGGTGKTTVAAAIASIERNSVAVDCDVDASNLYLYYKAEEVSSHPFSGADIARVNAELCTRCGCCTPVCRFGAISSGNVNKFRCEGCGACTLVCPTHAIAMMEVQTAVVKSDSRAGGKLVWATMAVGSEGSGKLVTHLRQVAEEVNTGNNLTIMDGSPGLGCAVIASIVNTDGVLIVTEPTQTALSDYVRIEELCRHFGLRTFVCVNKYDINLDITRCIEDKCRKSDATFVGTIPYDETVLMSIEELVPIVQYKHSPAAKGIISVWNRVKERME